MKTANTPHSKLPSKRKQINGWRSIVDDYLACYTPVATYAPDVILKSTDEIINALSSMVDLEINDVAEMLVEYGYHSYHLAGETCGWMMKRVN